MRLVFLSHDSSCTGGAQRCLLDLLKGIKRNYPDWQLYMVFPAQGDFVDVCSRYLDGYKILRLKWWLVDGKCLITKRKKLSYIYKLLRSSFKLFRYLQQIKPDCGITNTIVVPHMALSSRLLGIKHYWFIHEIPDVTWGDKCFIFKSQLVFKLVDRFSTKVLIPSEYAKQYYQNVISRDKLNTITQAVELSSDVNVNQYRESCERYTILLVGAFDSNKGQMELLQAVKRIVDAGKDIYCYLVGSDIGLKSVCQEYIRMNDLERNVEINPFTNQIYLYYYMTDVLLVCSTVESFGRVAVEAQKCGLPVILSNVGANPERIENGVNGLLYKKGDITDLVEKIEILRDVRVRKKFSEKINLDMLGKYSIDCFASNFVKLVKA